MLTCITCSKQQADDGEEAPRGTPNTKDAVKTLTNQIKDMALKVSGSSKQSKGESSYKYKYPEFDISQGGPSYMQAGSSTSTPAWDFTSSAAHHRYQTTGDQTPDARESISTKYGEVMLESDNEPKEWTAQVEPGVQITFVSLPRGGNDLKRIRFNREMFDKWEAQRWWGENYERIMELYNVQKFNQQAFNTPGRSEDGRDSVYSRLESPRMTPSVRYRPSFPGEQYYNNPSGAGGSSRGYGGGRPSYMEAGRETNASEASVAISNASDIESEWIQEDEPGVYITIRQLVDGTRELRRVRFSREKFGEVNAKHWWETNRDRIQNQYL